jgi:hypothetical protein
MTLQTNQSIKMENFQDVNRNGMKNREPPHRNDRHPASETSSRECSSNTVEARVEVATFTGDGLEFQALADSKLIRGRTNPWINLEIGQRIYLHCPPERGLLLSSAESLRG